MLIHAVLGSQAGHRNVTSLCTPANLKCVSETKILGIVVDKILSFLPRSKTLKPKLSLVTAKLYSYSGVNWGISGSQFRQIHLRLIEKALTYAAPV